MTSRLSQPEPRVVDRVRKLMDKSARTENRHEAEAFAQKAAELVAEHRIDPERLAQPAEGALEVMEIAIGRGAYVRARLALLMGIAAVNDVHRVVRRRGDPGGQRFEIGHSVMDPAVGSSGLRASA